MIRKKVKTDLLRCATPEAIMRLPYSKKVEKFADLFDTYFSHQKHSSLKEYLLDYLKKPTGSRELMLQVSKDVGNTHKYVTSQITTFF